MRHGYSVVTSAFCALWLSSAGSGPLAAQTPPIPNELRADHVRIQQRLRDLSLRADPVGKAAKQVLVLLVPHDQREEEFVLPLVGLLEQVAADRIRPDMALAIPMADKLKAEKDRLSDEHTAVIDALLVLRSASLRSHEPKVTQFAEDIASDEVNDGQVVYPAAILVGKYIRDKLPATR